MVLRASSVGASVLARVYGGGGSDIWVQTVSSLLKFAVGSATVSVASPSYFGLANGTPHIVGSVYDGTAASLSVGLKPYFDGSPASGDVSGTLPASLSTGTPDLWIGSNINANNWWNNDILEVISYSRALSLTERQKLERYLSAKWGVTLAPQVLNADAQDWIGRVYAAGGTVSTATAVAVNTFCDAIDSAGIRDKFYRLNLFCGGTSGAADGLAACLVPLYRGPSLTGTQYGGGTDANNGPFVVGDYAETGASGGLWYGGVGTNISKYLNTGLNGSDLSPGNRHAAAYEIVSSTTDYSPSVVSGSVTTAMHGIGPWTNVATYAYRTHNTVGGNTTATKNTGFWLGSDTSSTASVLYRNGSSANSATGQPAGGSGGTPYYILGNPAGEWSEARLGGYSIGLSMTNAQVAAYYSAMQAFQTALVRNV
jgi:hypothetical protein